MQNKITNWHNKNKGKFFNKNDYKKFLFKIGYIVEEKKDFKNYQVNEKIIETNNAIFMHDLPAHHGEEISENLVDHKNSVVFDQAENRIWGQLGIIKKIV